MISIAEAFPMSGTRTERRLPNGNVEVTHEDGGIVHVMVFGSAPATKLECLQEAAEFAGIEPGSSEWRWKRGMVNAKCDRGLALIDRAIVKASREMRGA